MPSYTHMNSHTAVASITCLLFSSETKSAAPSEPTHHTSPDLRMNRSRITSRHISHRSGKKEILGSFKVTAAPESLSTYVYFFLHHAEKYQN